MPERQIRLFGDPVLKTVSDPILAIDDGVRGLVQDLVDSVRLPGRAGVAAAQIGVNLRAFSYHVDGDVGYILNPTLAGAGRRGLPVRSRTVVPDDALSLCACNGHRP